ncbi:MAG: DUF5993 family protein [Gammaproteobacteria bacterium]
MPINANNRLLIGGIAMILLIFIFLFLSVLFAWKGQRRYTLIFFALTLGLSIIWFLIHIDVHLVIQL